MRGREPRNAVEDLALRGRNPERFTDNLGIRFRFRTRRLKHNLWCEGGFLLFALRFGVLGLHLFSRLVARSVLVTGSPCSLQGLCVAQRHRLGDLLAVRFDDALLACGPLRSLDETIRDRTEACG